MKSKVWSFVYNHKRGLFTVGEIVGILGLTYSASKNGYNTHKDLQGKDYSKKEKLIIGLKNHISTFIWLGFTLCCIAGKEKATADELTKAALAYSALSTKMNNYRIKTNELYGNDADTKIQRTITEEHIQKNIPVAGEQPITFFDTAFNFSFVSTYNKVRIAELELNKMYQENDRCTMGDFYKLLGMTDQLPSDILSHLDVYGWVKDGSLESFEYEPTINFNNSFYDDVGGPQGIIEYESGPYIIE